ncbi:hypothetical protein CSA37_07125 [Candidatus Fermentibacteria bacterium]|nr:MAG: hypothetical protein CSA37_10020 [Candidatus Fermentibacteria bacterium]PIE52329.1 MAG: hypothetical protein CSA37_07125 [Candidatus Fermentibacteria bacterium]
MKEQMPDRSVLERQIKAWLNTRNAGHISIPPPETAPPAVPDPSDVTLSIVPEIQESLEKISTVSQLGSSVPALASLISVMSKKDYENLYDLLSVLKVPSSFDETVAENWFRQCHRLSTSIIPVAVTGYFRIHSIFSDQCKAGKTDEILSCWLRPLMSEGATGERAAAISLEIAERFPDRFASVCMRISSGGAEIIDSLEKFLKRTDQEKNSEDINSYLLDFTIETGWLLEPGDFEQIWNLIKRRGQLVHPRLNSKLVPVSSIRFLAGILHGIEVLTAFDDFFASEREQKAMEVFKTKDRKLIREFLAEYHDLGGYLDDQMEIDLVAEAVAHIVGDYDQSKTGMAIVSFLTNVPGGVSSGMITGFLQTAGEEISGETVQFLTRLVEETSLENRLSPSNTIIFSGIAAKIFPISSAADRAALKMFYRALTEMKYGETRTALIQLENAAFNSGLSINSILSAASLLARAAAPEEVTKYLCRIKTTARLLEALSVMDRKKMLSDFAHPWLATLVSFPDSVHNNIVDFIYRISDLTVRKRFLDNVVSRLLAEVQPQDPVFQECLAFAVNGYNSASGITKIRDTEHNVFHKVLRASGRIEAVDTVITSLLSIPGIEENRSRELIDGIRLVCDRFSRIAVWEEGADRLFADFLETGVSKILHSFVDNPQLLEASSAGIVKEIAARLLPEHRCPDSSTVTNPAAVCKIFLESILPECASLFSREPSRFRGFLFSLTREFTGSIGGVTGDKDYILHLSSRLEEEIVEDKVMVLDAWLSQKSPPPINLDKNWSESRLDEWVAERAVFENTRMKLFGAVSALVGSEGSSIRENILNTAGFLASRLSRAGIQGADTLSLIWNREMMEELISRADGASPFSLLAEYRKGVQPDWQIYAYLKKTDGFMEEDAYHSWRYLTLPQLLNCAVELELVSLNSSFTAIEIAEAATSAIEFLGYSNTEAFLSTLKQSFNSSGSLDAFQLLEKNFLLPLWKRNSSERLNLRMLGMSRGRQITEILSERLEMIKSVNKRVSFMKGYSNLFIAVEDALLQIDTDRSKIAEALMNSVIFSGDGVLPDGHGAFLEVSEAVDFIKDIFKRIRFGSGIVSTREAEEISSDMRRKYRDNADSVAIILRWTVDPAREGLLKILEESQTLLQAAGSDSELMRLLDRHGADAGFEQETMKFTENPEALKNYLRSRIADAEKDSI